ncbi:MAG TPA: hypothetical protein VHF69_14010, partial [Candidatus Synoicihabitans sp.]|nr:hypothetical protein [Candidatus Synoicihabitans sp.]
MKSLARLMTAVVLASAADLPAADDSASQRRERIAAIFQPFQTDRAALAPDGRHLAYELRRDERLFLVIVNLDRNEAVELPLTEDAPMPLSGVSEKVPKRLTQLLWATSTRLIGTVMDELLFGVNADGGEFKILLDSRDLEWMTESVRKRAEGMKPSPRLIPGYDVSSPGFSTQGGLSGRELTQQMREEEWARQINPAYDAQNTDEFGRPQPSVLSMHSDLGSPSQTDLFNSASTVGAVPTWRVFVADPLDDQPDQILVEIRGRASPWDDGGTLGADPAPNAYDVITALARVDPSSGKVRWSHDNFGTSRMLGDRSGKFRLALEHFNTRREYKVAMKPGAKLENLDRLLAEVGLPPATVSPANYFDVRTIPLGFDPAVNRLYVASNYERDTYGVYALDLESRQRTEIAIEHPTIDLADINEALAEGVFVFDRHQRRLVGVRVPDLRPQTLWLDAEIESLQKALAQRAPTTDFEILEWNAERTRFLLLASARSQPGAYFIYERATGELREFVQRAPWVRAALANSSQPFAFKTPAGVTLRG